jgi:RNA-binding protein YlmH
MALEGEKELQQLKNRFHDLAQKSFQQGIFLFTPFLGLSEQDVFRREEINLSYAGCEVFGGCPDADRVMVRFGRAADLGYEIPFPIACIHIEPLLSKFAEQLSHRDFLGALMNLGIERSTIGDIKVGEKEAYLFCQEAMAPYICENLTQVRHTHVKCSITEQMSEVAQEEPERMVIQVQSLRVDAVIAKVYHLSREKSLELFRAGRVYVDGRLCENNSRILKEGESINARGFGKCRMDSLPKETKKGKLAVTVAVYR